MNECCDLLKRHRISLRLDWANIANLSAKRLSAISGREIEPSADRYEYYYWGFRLDKTPLTKDEIDLLFDTVGADENDRDANDFGDYPIVEINKSLAEKTIKPLLPFLLSESLADDEGVWLFGPPYPAPFDPALESSEVNEDDVGIARCSKCATMITCDGDGQMPDVCPGCNRKLGYCAYRPNKCKCGNDKFYAHQVCHHDITTDGNGHYIEDRGVYHSKTPFGPFVCTTCGESYDELPSR